MFGYIEPVRPELKLREIREFGCFYCGVCTSLTKQNYVSKFFLTYDSVFFSVLLSGLAESEPRKKRRFCYLTLKPVCFYESELIDYASGAFSLLLKYKFLDDQRDQRSFLKKVLSGLIVSDRVPVSHETKSELERKLRELWELESADAELEELASKFGEISRLFFAVEWFDRDTKLILEHLGFHLGRWVYILDAFDDLEHDVRRGSFNPLLKRQRSCVSDLEDLKQAIKPWLRELLYSSIDEVIKAYDLLLIRRFKGILDNIVYLGLSQKTEFVLEKRPVAKNLRCAYERNKGYTGGLRHAR